MLISSLTHTEFQAIHGVCVCVCVVCVCVLCVCVGAPAGVRILAMHWVNALETGGSVCVCECVYVCTRTHTYTHTYAHFSERFRRGDLRTEHVFMSICMCLHTHIVCTHIHPHTHGHEHPHPHKTPKHEGKMRGKKSHLVRECRRALAPSLFSLHLHTTHTHTYLACFSLHTHHTHTHTYLSCSPSPCIHTPHTHTHT